MSVRIAFAAGISLFFLNCAATTKLAPLAPLAQGVPVPLQQEQMAAAARTAINQAVSALEFQDLTGKQARVKVAGAFPPSGHDLLDFVGAVAESQLAERGVRIEPKAVPHAVLLQNNAPLPQPDFVASITLDASGVDLTMIPQLTGPIIMIAAGGGAMALGLSATVVGLLTFSTAALVIGGALGAIGLPVLIIGAIWASFAPQHYIADGRVRLALTVQPVSTSVRPQTRAGEGTNTVRYEPNKAGGYKPRLPFPF